MVSIEDAREAEPPAAPSRPFAAKLAGGRLRDLARGLAGDVRGGLVASTTCLAFSISNGALIYSAVPQPMLVAGIIAGLVTTVVASLVFALTSTFRPVVALANVVTAAPLAAIVVVAAPALAALPPSRAVATAYALVGVTTLLTGVVLFLLGFSRVGNLVRFVPFPVMAGFTAVSGALFVLGSLRLSTGITFTFANLPRFAQASTLAFLLPTVALAIFLTVAVRRFKHPLVLPYILLVSSVAVNLAVPPGTMQVDEATLRLIFLSPRLQAAPQLSLPAAQLLSADWSLIRSLAGSIGAYLLLVTIATLLTSNGLESALNVDADYDRELRSQGVTCVASAALGGFVGNASVGATMAGVVTGARGRAAGLASCVVAFGFLLFGLPLLPYIPRPVLAALVMHLGISVLDVWCVRTRRTMPRGEWCLVIAIVAVTVWFGLVPAIAAGILGGCVLFVLDISRVAAVRRCYGLNCRASPVVRSAEALAVLSREGAAVQVVELQGMLFFGSAHAILMYARRLLANAAPVMLVVDMTAVTGCDSSATAKLARMRKLLAGRGIGFAVAGAGDKLAALLRSTGCILPGDAVHRSRDEALEAGEALVLSRAEKVAPIPEGLAQSLGSDLAERLIGELKAEHHTKGSYLCRQGEPTTTLLFIESGRIGVMVGPPEAEVCVRIFGPHSVVGEQGFLLQQPRSASLKAEADTTALVLDRGVFETLGLERPDLAMALLLFMFRIQAERLAFSTRQIAALA